MRETRLLQVPLQAGEDGVFEGYASLFHAVDLSKDVVMPGAFGAGLKRRGPAAVRMLWQHDPAQPIGRWILLREDARGLFARGRLNLDVARARELRSLLREGSVDGLSIGFRAERARREGRTGLRRIERVDLWEISLVTFPMLPGARVSFVKGARTLPSHPKSIAATHLPRSSHTRIHS